MSRGARFQCTKIREFLRPLVAVNNDHPLTAKCHRKVGWTGRDVSAHIPFWYHCDQGLEDVASFATQDLVITFSSDFQFIHIVGNG